MFCFFSLFQSYGWYSDYIQMVGLYEKIVWKYVTLISCFHSQRLLFRLKLKMIFAATVNIPLKHNLFRFWCVYVSIVFDRLLQFVYFDLPIVKYFERIPHAFWHAFNGWTKSCRLFCGS